MAVLNGSGVLKTARASSLALATYVFRPAIRLSDGGVFPFVWLHREQAGTTSSRLHLCRVFCVRFVDDLPYSSLATAQPE